jgi:carbon monoxide dehydrogenase subunit G
MASIRREISIERSADDVWDALRDVGQLHTRLVPGFVVDCRLEAGARIVTFANGIVARELIVDVDDATRRVAWAVVGGRPTHHNASAQALPAADGACRVVWIADVLPDALAASMAGMIEHGLAAMKRTLEGGATADAARIAPRASR